jgi:membrane protein DedA with SNARE-associated domain
MFMAVSPKLWRTLAPAVTVLLIVVSLYLVWQAFHFPAETELIPVARAYFKEYGLVTVFFGALGEGLFLIGLYLPGTFVMLLGILFAGSNPARIVQVWAVIITGLVCAYAIDYAMGRFGWYRLFVAYGLRDSLEKARERLATRGISAVFTSFWQINIASLTATAAGTLQFPFPKFIICAACAAAAWMAFWVTIIVSLGPSALELVNLRFIIFALILWITWLALGSWLKARRAASPK